MSAMHEAMMALQADVAMLFATVVLLASLFLIARVGHVRQSIALAFALMPLLLAWAAIGVMTAQPAAAALL